MILLIQARQSGKHLHSLTEQRYFELGELPTMPTPFHQRFLTTVASMLMAYALVGPIAQGAGAARGPSALPPTPAKMNVPPPSDQYFSPRRVLKKARSLPDTPAGKSSREYADELKAQHAWGTDSGAGVRFRSKSKKIGKGKAGPAMSLKNAQKYTRSYGSLFNNNQGGRCNEEAILEGMGTPNNNYGKPWTFTTDIDGKRVTVRPDGVDSKSGRIVECKFRKRGLTKAGKRRVESKTRQFRAERKMADSLDFTLYHLTATEETDKENFPVLSSRFKEDDARFRLRDGKGFVHGWDFASGDWLPLADDQARQQGRRRKR